VQDILFFFFATWTLVAAGMVVFCRRPLYAAFGFGFSALGTASLCALAAAPFLAASLALLYGGTTGLVAATLFAALAIKGEPGRKGIYGAVALGLSLLLLMGHYIIGYRPPTEAEALPVTPGDLLFGEYALALYMVLALLLAAVLAISALNRGAISTEGE